MYILCRHKKFIQKKCEKHVELPLSLEIETFEGDTRTSGHKKYGLKALIKHCGDGIDDGHYIAFVKQDGSLNMWTMYNDDIVKEMHELDVLSQDKQFVTSLVFYTLV